MTTSNGGAAPSVVITGASTGIGEACALHLDQLGWRVFAGVRKDSDGEALQRKASPRLMPVRIDVTDAASIAGAREIVARELGDRGLDGLVNNAGVVVAGPLEFVPMDDLRRQLEINVIGQIAVTQAFLSFVRTARGRIVNIGSVSGKMATPFVGPYAASKFAMEALTDALRCELRPWGIQVSIVEPGSIATPIWEKDAGGRRSDGSAAFSRRTQAVRPRDQSAPRGRRRIGEERHPAGRSREGGDARPDREEIEDALPRW